MKAVQKRIWDAYLAAERLCESSRDADAWLRRSFEAAKDGEKRHRGHASARYKLPVADAARFFAVRWFFMTTAEHKLPKDFREACQLREDCLYAFGARDALTGPKLLEWAHVRESFLDVLALDYVKEFT
jgi:hypothetical protein